MDLQELLNVLHGYEAGAVSVDKAMMAIRVWLLTRGFEIKALDGLSNTDGEVS